MDNIQKLPQDLQDRYYREHEKITEKIKRNSRLDAVCRVLCYVCLLPALYSASCLGQNKQVPTESKVALVGVGASFATLATLRRKKEKMISVLRNLPEKYAGM